MFKHIRGLIRDLWSDLAFLIIYRNANITLNQQPAVPICQDIKRDVHRLRIEATLEQLSASHCRDINGSFKSIGGYRHEASCRSTGGSLSLAAFMFEQADMLERALMAAS